MEAGIETAPVEERHSINWNAIVLVPFATLLLYVLSAGPLVMMVDKHLIGGSELGVLEGFYMPLEGIYKNTALHKPIGMYLHLWSARFNANGDNK